MSLTCRCYHLYLPFPLCRCCPNLRTYRYLQTYLPFHYFRLSHLYPKSLIPHLNHYCHPYLLYRYYLMMQTCRYFLTSRYSLKTLKMLTCRYFLKSLLYLMYH
jgi:hypothetical protein